jgi:hypothetical protein
MPQLSNTRHERFCVLVTEGKNAAAAYEEAGYRRNDGNAHALRHREDISARINDLLAERQKQTAEATQIAVERAGLTKEWVIRGLIQNAEKALKAKEGSPVANRALELLGKELGMFIDRAEISQTNEFGGMSLDEMRVELVARARRLGLDRELAGLLGGPADQDVDDPGLN